MKRGWATRKRSNWMRPAASSPAAARMGPAAGSSHLSRPAPEQSASGRGALARHLAIALELRALVQDQTWRGDRAFEPRCRQQLESFARDDLAVDLPRHGDPGARDPRC